jgi:hypothetical protein
MDGEQSQEKGNWTEYALEKPALSPASLGISQPGSAAKCPKGMTHRLRCCPLGKLVRSGCRRPPQLNAANAAYRPLQYPYGQLAGAIAYHGLG